MQHQMKGDRVRPVYNQIIFSHSSKLVNQVSKRLNVKKIN